MFWPKNHTIASSTFKEPYFQFETQMSSNNDVTNVLNILECKESWQKVLKIESDLL